MFFNLVFAFVAGSLSILSPCVLPLLPVVLGTAASKGRFGPLLMAAGLVLSFVMVGLFISLIGFSIGLDGKFFRAVSAVMLIAIGLLLAVSFLQRQFAMVIGPAASWAQKRFGSGEAGGQFGIGILLGAVWSPCVGPTLGAASLLAARGENLATVIITMLCFGLGVAMPLVLIGMMSRDFLMRWRGRMVSSSATVKSTLGILFVLTGVMIISGQDKFLEAALVEASPEWLTALTTRF